MFYSRIWPTQSSVFAATTRASQRRADVSSLSSPFFPTGAYASIDAGFFPGRQGLPLLRKLVAFGPDGLDFAPEDAVGDDKIDGGKHNADDPPDQVLLPDHTLRPTHFEWSGYWHGRQLAGRLDRG